MAGLGQFAIALEIVPDARMGTGPEVRAQAVKSTVDKTMKPLSTSVILPVYNDQKNLQACLAALANQTLPHDQFEVIVVDNDSLPAMILPGLSHLNMTLLYCARPGSYAARNAGLRIANGKVIAFLDVDCLPDKRWLATGMEAIHEAPRKTLVGGNVKFDFPENPSAIELFQHIRISGQKINIEQKRYSVTANLFARREEIMLVGEFQDSLLSGGDREWCWRAIEQGFDIKFSELTTVTTRYRDTLKAAITQVRRITGGHYHLKKKMNFKNHVAGPGVSSSAFISPGFFQLLRRAELPLSTQCRVTGIAIVLRITQILELLRLRAGFTAERR